MNLLAIPRRMRGDLGSLLPRTARAFEVFANLLAPGTGCVEVFLCVAFDLWSASSARSNFVSKLAQPVGQLGLIDGRGELLPSWLPSKQSLSRLAWAEAGSCPRSY